MTTRPPRDLSRRRLLAALPALAAAPLLGGCSRVQGVLADGAQSLGLADTRQTDRGFTSERMGGRETTWRVLEPTEHDGRLRAILYLHGKGGDHATALRRWVADDPLLHARDDGPPPLALVTVDAGDDYYHPRADGTDAGAMIASELLPRMRDEAGIDVSVLGLAGFSMGGYGALLLASGWDAAASPTRTRIGAVSAADPALWLDAGDSAPGAFDDREDFEAHDVFAPPRVAALEKLPVWIGWGDRGAFGTAAQRLQDELRCEGGVRPGEHDERFQKEVVGEQFDFLHRHLA